MGTLRTPRACLTVNGTDIICTEVEVTLSKTHDCDRVHACIPFDALPAGMDLNWWSTANDIKVQAKFANDGPPSVVLFDGTVDEADPDWDNFCLTITGRCKTAKLADKRTKAKHINKHHHEIVQDLASAHGLEVDADPVTDKAGKIYQIDFAAIPHQETEWTFIQHLAETSNMDCYATGGKVYFKNPDEQLPVFQVTYQPGTSQNYADGNWLSLKGSRNLQLGRPVSHKVSTWNHKEKRAYSDTETEQGVGDPLEFHHNEPGVSQGQTSKIAKKRLRDTTKHELNVTVSMPGDSSVTPRMTLELSGTGTAFDQQHEISTVTHKATFDGGYEMTISTKTKSKRRGKK